MINKHNYKIKIEKNTVQETLVMPLYGKAWAVNNLTDLINRRTGMRSWRGLNKDYWLFWFASSLGMGQAIFSSMFFRFMC